MLFRSIVNTCATGAFGIVVGDGGAGTTVTVGSGVNGISATIRMDAGGAVRVTPDNTLV